MVASILTTSQEQRVAHPYPMTTSNTSLINQVSRYLTTTVNLILSSKLLLCPNTSACSNLSLLSSSHQCLLYTCDDNVRYQKLFVNSNPIDIIVTIDP